MTKQFFLLMLWMIGTLPVIAQPAKTKNIILVTLDGMRWQEIFGGADRTILMDKRFTRDSADLTRRFWTDHVEERRKKLFPFFWTTIAARGQLYGDRNNGSEVNNANPYKFSYPGYNEMLTGYPDTAVNSNDKILNKNRNVLEFLNEQPGFHGKVAVFSTWDVFPFILNKWRSGIYVNADTDSLPFSGPGFELLNNLQKLSPRPLGVRPDVITYFAAREYLKAFMPRVLYIAFDETDDYAHEGQYDQYLNSAHAEDGMIADLWNTIQSIPAYKDQTTLLVTCDHGRGDEIKEQWRDHGEKVADAGHIWMVVIGPDTQAEGLVKTPSPLWQKQIAPTIASLLGLHFVPEAGNADPVLTILK